MRYCFTPSGEYRYHHDCIVSTLHVHPQVLSAIQRYIKRKTSSRKQLYLEWFNEKMEHGLKNKSSNHSKPELYKQVFRLFIKRNRSSTGRLTQKIKYIMDPAFTRIKPKKAKGTSKFVKEDKRSLTYGFSQYLTKVAAKGMLRFLLRN